MNRINWELEGKNKKSSELAFAAPWLVPSPRYFAKLLLTG